MKKIVILLLAISNCSVAFAQNVGIGTLVPDPSAQLDISTSSKGLLIPRMSSSAVGSIANPAKGLMVYDSVKNEMLVNMGTPASPNWQSIGAKSAWNLTGNSGTDPSTQFIGTVDNLPLYFRVNNAWAGSIDSNAQGTFLGFGAGKTAIGGIENTALGFKALYSNSTGYSNTAAGVTALYSNTTGIQNAAYGTGALYSNTSGSSNTATGKNALYSNTTASANTATGYGALYSNTTGASNTATGVSALASNISGSNNTATGANALGSNTTGSLNTALGESALFGNTSGYLNTAGGYQTLYSNDLGHENTGIGAYSLISNTSGSYNTALGSSALLLNGPTSQNTAVGYASLSQTISSDGNTALGYRAGATWSNGYYNCFIGSETDANGPDYYNTIAIGHGTLVTAPNMMRVGNGATTSIGGPVGWSVISDGRVKKNIKEDVPGLAFIRLLRPISYTLDLDAIDRIVQPPVQKTTDGKIVARVESPQFKAACKAKEQIVYTGFVAQEVEQAAKSLNYNFSGVDAPKNDKDLYGLRYSDFVVPIVKAVQEQQSLIEDLQKQINEIKALIKK
jgi:trimeric autotransporter adhesin